MKRVRLNSRRACQQSWSAVRQQPLLLAFSLVSLGAHLLGWALFAAAEQVDSGVLAALLHLLGIALYAGSLLWMIEGFTEAGLSLAQGKPLAWSLLSPGACCQAGRLCLCLGTLVAALAVTGLITGLIWSLLLLALPAMSVVPVLLGLITAAALSLSQLFGPCLVVDMHLSASSVFRQGLWLLEHHWAGLIELSSYLLALVLLPLLAGLLAEALVEGLGIPATVASLVVVLPLITTSVTGAYWQLRPELASSASINRSDR